MAPSGVSTAKEPHRVFIWSIATPLVSRGIADRWFKLPDAIGLAYSIYPDIVIGRMTLWEASAATESLQFIFWGATITLPAILGYTLNTHRVFSGKATELS